jgi:hypothetical protein
VVAVNQISEVCHKVARTELKYQGVSVREKRSEKLYPEKLIPGSCSEYSFCTRALEELMAIEHGNL